MKPRQIGAFFMKSDRDEIINKLYNDNLTLQASINLLKDIFIAYVYEKDGKEKATAFSSYFDQSLSKYREDIVLSSPAKDEYLDDQSKNTLDKFRDLLK